ncbi:recombinase family protein [Thalassotalea mangrovi]|uniref:Resolvase n=1 Tax=Thalassotalea mangrovi TaxID=2572245 RepID=A0A4U1B1Z7_9GAMM|nr:recombinase family protein [Thalassotalea mangrovi]TKB43554.1 resolvase [Thalassotalea mangrovi]
MHFIAYYRVSTQRQGLSGLGLEAQRSVVEDYIHRQSGVLLHQYTEVESGKKDDRPQLLKALQHCQLTNSTLVVSKLDRLSRDLHFLSTVMKSNIQFVCCDQPNSGTLVLQVLAAVAEEERRAISERTKLALAAAKKRGVKLGNPNLDQVRNTCMKKARIVWQQNNEDFNNAIIPVIENIQQQGITSYLGISRELNRLGFKTRYGKRFYSTTVRNILVARSSQTDT